MLNEAYRVAKSLQRAGIVPDATSGDVKPPGMSGFQSVFVHLRADGSFAGVGAIEKDDEPGLWTIMEGKQNSFPVVRFKKPLIVFALDHPIWAELALAGRSNASDEKTRDVLLAHIDPETAEVPDKVSWLRLRDMKAPAVMARAGEQVPEVAELCARFIRATPDPEAFFKGLARAVIDDLKVRGAGNARAARELLVGKEPTKGKPEASVQLALDLDGGKTVYRKERKVAMSTARSGDAQMALAISTSVGHCAYTGECDDPWRDPFPPIKVPVFGREFPLLSMFTEMGEGERRSPLAAQIARSKTCNVRYGLADERIVPISSSIVRAAHGALSHLFAAENEGSIWRAVASGQLERKSGKTFDKKDLLVAYVGEGDAPTNAARLGGVPKGENYRQEAQALIKSLQGVAYHNPSARLELFVLRAVSKGQAQAVYSEQPLVTEVFEGAAAWASGQEDRPATILDPKKREGILVSPEDAVRTLSYVWRHDGTDSHRKTGILLGQAFDLLLRRPGRADDAAREILALVVARATPLLRAVGTELRQGALPGPDRSFAARRVINLVGLCLNYFNVTQDQTMNEPAYLVGRLLGLADKLHIQYCRVVRGGQIPPTLIGNALLGTALDSPVSALATLADRIRIYLGWADTADVPPEGSKRIAILTAKKTRRELAEVEDALSNNALPTQCDDLMKAQMLLGYLSRTKTDADVPEIETKEEETNNAE